MQARLKVRVLSVSIILNLLTIQCKTANNKQSEEKIANVQTQNGLQLADDGTTFVQDLLRTSIYTEPSNHVALANRQKKFFDEIATMDDSAFQNKYQQESTNPLVRNITQELRNTLRKDGVNRSRNRYISEIESDMKALIQNTDKKVQEEKITFEIDDLFKGEGTESLNKLINDYFKTLPLPNKKKLLASLCTLPPNAARDAKIFAALDGAGPILQKFMQLMSDRVDDPELKNILNKLKTNISPLSNNEIASAIANSAKGFANSLGWDTVGIQFSDSDDVEAFKKKKQRSLLVKRLGAASVGQAILVNNYGEIQVAKVRRPNIDLLFQNERNMLYEWIKNNPNKLISNAMEKSFESIEGELNFENEVKNINSVAPGYAEGHSNTIAIKGTFLTKDILVMDFAEGKAFSEFKSGEELGIRAEAVEDFYSNWLSRALLGDGKFHADAHAGNLFLNYDAGTGKYTITPIDYGSVGVLKAAEQDAAVLFGLGIKQQNPELIYNALEKLSTNLNSKSTPEKIKVFIQNTLNDSIKAKLDPSERLVTKLGEKGLQLSSPFLLFIRSQAFFTNQFTDVNRLALSEGKAPFSFENKGMKSIQPRLQNKVIDLYDRGHVTENQVPELKQLRKYRTGVRIGVATILLAPFMTVFVIDNADDLKKLVPPSIQQGLGGALGN